MKKASQVFVGLFVLLLTTNVKAQSKSVSDFFVGKWNIVLKDVPGGDAKMVFVLEKKGDTLTGVVLDTAGVEISKMTKVDPKESELTVEFSTQGYDLSLIFTKKDDDHLAGRLMDMFDALAERVKAKLN